ncbi:hypothetical protein [Azospirillum largimobile]
MAPQVSDGLKSDPLIDGDFRFATRDGLPADLVERARVRLSGPGALGSGLSGRGATPRQDWRGRSRFGSRHPV